ncbi:MAG: pyruvate kinase, partial [Acidaminococcales bacterium]|jgi:pyruvate kinase|nr:pyruvate kinase [Acidaminococcales bacterium]
VVITAGVPVGMAGSTNLINVIIVGNILVRGTGIGKKVVKGKACVVRSESDLSKFNPGDILVVHDLETSIVPYALKASAIIAEEGGLTSQAAIVSVSYGVPAVVGAADAAFLQNGMNITVDAARGLIYYGNGNK